MTSLPHLPDHGVTPALLPGLLPPPPQPAPTRGLCLES